MNPELQEIIDQIARVADSTGQEPIDIAMDLVDILMPMEERRALDELVGGFEKETLQ